MRDHAIIDDDYDEDAMHRSGEAVCSECERPAVRVVRWGLCEDCLDYLLDARARERFRRSVA